MAHLIKAQCQVKPLFNGQGMLIGFEPRYHFHKHKIGFNITAKLLSSSSSSISSSPDDHKLKEDFSSDDDSSCYNVGYDLFFDNPEYVRDELSCFRGLVLDVSYRF